jgi:HSP20 family molecular chaperone IbpA
MKSTKSQLTSRVTSLQPYDREALERDMQEIQLAIARRAYELFEARNCEHGYDCDDWFQAESELLRPVSIAVSETSESFSLRANVAGFSAKELKVGVEPQRIVIVGRKEVSAAGATDEAPPADSHPDQVLRLIALPSEIDPAGAVVEVQSGVLRFELPKVATAQASAAGAA